MITCATCGKKVRKYETTLVITPIKDGKFYEIGIPRCKNCISGKTKNQRAVDDIVKEVIENSIVQNS